MRSTIVPDGAGLICTGSIGNRLFASLFASSCATAILMAALVGCDAAPPKNAPQAQPPTVADKDQSPVEPTDRGPLEDGRHFTDVTRAWGLETSSEPWPDGKFMTPEITPGGVASLDYDGDGRLDIYLVCHCAAGSFTEPAPNRLFRQRDDGTFHEIPEAAGLADPGFGHGVAVGDFDNDGDVDVFVTNYGPNAFYRNEGNRRFVNASETVGISGDHWSSSAGFFDYDRDGHLDLYVVNFAVFDETKKCLVASDPTDLDYCGPHQFDGVLDTLYHNNGDGTFSDVTAEAGIVFPGRGWGLCCADVTGDGWCDVYVANDEEPAQLWVNQHDGTFEEEAVFRGCAFNGAGRVEAGMGVGVADVDGDQKLDLFKTHIASETNTLYLTGGLDELYADRSATSQMANVDRPYTGWGCGFFDYDHDGNLDMAVANGRVTKGVPQAEAKLGKFWNRFAEPNLLFAGNGRGQFKNVSSKAGAFGSDPLVSRGLALADWDRDGDLDMAVQQIDNTVRLYRNDAPPAGAHWLAVRTMTGSRDAYGALVAIEAGGRKLLRLAHPTYSYLASNDPRAHFGLGKIDKIDSLVVTWPSGGRERFEPPSVDQAIVLVEGKGTAVEQAAGD